MASMKDSAITKAGRNLIAKGIAGKIIEFTKIVVGDGLMPAGKLAEDMTSIVHAVITVDITKIKVLGDGKVIVGGIFNNSTLTNDFYYREIGLFAKDLDEGEILYCYANAGSEAEKIPAPTGNTVTTKSVDIRTLVESTQNVIAKILPESYISIETFNEHLQDYKNPHKVTTEQIGAANKTELDTHVKNKLNPHGVTTTQIGAATTKELSTHISDKVNPHSVTATQVGAMSIEEGDSLGATFEAHRVNKNNPHSVTKSQIGLSNVDNVKQYSVNNKPTKSDVGLGSVDNTADKDKVVKSAEKWTTPKNGNVNLSSTSKTSIDGSGDFTLGVMGITQITNGGTGNTTGNAASATKLQTGRFIYTSLDSGRSQAFDGSGNVYIGRVGTLPLLSGGTGRTNGISADNVLGGIFYQEIQCASIDRGQGSWPVRGIHVQNSAGNGANTHNILMRRQ